MAGRKIKYTRVGLRKAVERYFDSISRTVTLTEKAPTGEKDEYGHKVYEDRPVLNKAGEEVRVTEYLVPPTEAGLCLALGIHRSTWSNYCDKEQHPEFFDTTSRARGRLRAYLEEQALTRNNVKGVVFLLEMEEARRAADTPRDDSVEIRFVEMEEEQA